MILVDSLVLGSLRPRLRTWKILKNAAQTCGLFGKIRHQREASILSLEGKKKPTNSSSGVEAMRLGFLEGNRTHRTAMATVASAFDLASAKISATLITINFASSIP